MASKAITASSNVSLSAEVSVKGETGRPSDYWYENAIFLISLSKQVLAPKLWIGLSGRLGPKKIKSGKYPVIIENRAVSSILYPLYSALLGSSIYQKQSFLIGKENKAVASPKLTVLMIPLFSLDSDQHFLTARGWQLSKDRLLREAYCVISISIPITAKN